MGSFEDHIKFGVMAHFISAILLIGLVYTTPVPMLAAMIGVLALPVTLAGASFPDIDHPKSKPNRMFRKILFGGGILASAWVFGQTGFSETQAHLQDSGAGEAAFSIAAVATVAVALVGGFWTRLMFDVLRPTHRGMTHRLPIGAVVTIGLAAVTWALATSAAFSAPLLLAGVVGWLFLVGFLSHLACDGVLFQMRTYTQFR